MLNIKPVTRANYRLRFYSDMFTHILSLRNLYNDQTLMNTKESVRQIASWNPGFSFRQEQREFSKKIVPTELLDHQFKIEFADL